MSALIPHAKALHALASAFQYESERIASSDPPLSSLLIGLSIAYSHAADDLGDQIRKEASGPAFEDRPQRGRRE